MEFVRTVRKIVTCIICKPYRQLNNGSLIITMYAVIMTIRYILIEAWSSDEIFFWIYLN